MKRRILSVVVSAALLPLAAAAFNDGDFQNWSAVSLDHTLATNVTAHLEEEARFGNDASDLFYYHTDVGFMRRVRSWLDLGLSFRYIRNKVAGEWKDEDTPLANAALKWKRAGFQFEDRNRVEYRMREDADDVFRYRNRIQVQRHVRMGGAAFDPYMSEEAFIDSGEGDFNQFRTAAGVKARLTDSIRGDVYYLWQAVEKSTDWTSAHVLGLRLSCTF